MTKPTLLLQNEHVDRLLDGALEDRFAVARPWLAGDPQAAIEACGPEVIAVLGAHADASLLARLPNLRLIVAPGAGYENIDVAAAQARGIKVANAGDTHSGDVADHAVALVLALLHRLPEAQDWIRTGRWSGGASPPRRHGMSEQRFGIVGLGNIGTAIARRLAAFGGQIAWWSRSTKAAPWPRKGSLMHLARWCTALIVATRGDAHTLIDADVISAVGPQGLIVNVSRGAVIDEDALVTALTNGGIGAVGLDVFRHEPIAAERWPDLPNVILTPHIAGVSHGSMARLREAAIRNIETVLDGGPLVHEVTS